MRAGERALGAAVPLASGVGDAMLRRSETARAETGKGKRLEPPSADERGLQCMSARRSCPRAVPMSARRSEVEFHDDPRLLPGAGFRFVRPCPLGRLVASADFEPSGAERCSSWRPAFRAARCSFSLRSLPGGKTTPAGSAPGLCWSPGFSRSVSWLESRLEPVRPFAPPESADRLKPGLQRGAVRVVLEPRLQPVCELVGVPA
jgi:hypothetical protein